ncbi:MAG TPA: hypothetical protein VKU82_12395 [Planctomycetaceae bacterium]|nr:hypothetical protein [Planctomycetaceae bacterium]
MAPVTINGKPVGPQPGSEVVSRSAILILSGALIGSTISRPDLSGLSFYGFCAGIVGMISFCALDLASRQRRKQAVRKRLAAARLTLAGRIRRHLAAPAAEPVHRRSPLPASETSYLPVTPGWR